MLSNKGISAIMRGTSLSQADPFVKMSVTAVLSGMASKASGGDFVQGAMSAMVVWLYNDFMTQEEFKRMQGVYNDSRNVRDRASAQQSIGRAMKLEPYNVRGNGGISDKEAKRNDIIALSLAGGLGTTSSIAVFGIVKTLDGIAFLLLNYQGITGKHVNEIKLKSLRRKGTSIEKMEIESRKNFDFNKIQINPRKYKIRIPKIWIP